MTAFWDKLKKKDEEKKDKKTPVISDEKTKENDEKKTEKKFPKKDSSSGKKSKKETKKVKKTKKKKILLTKEEAEVVGQVLVQPKISEASMNQQAMNKYVFVVKPDASKAKIKDAVESMYGVSVSKVNVMNYSPVKRMFRGFAGKVKGFKKAIVTLKQGDSIDLFSEK